MPLLPRIGPGEVVPLRQVRPDDVGGGAGQAAYAGAAQDLGAITARLIGAERQADVARAEVGYGAELAELAQKIDQEPDVDAREAKFEEARRDIANKYREGVRGPQYQAEFDQRAFQLGERAKLVVREGVIRKRLDNARGGVIESADKFDRLIEHAESDQLRKGYVFARSNILDAGVASGAISATERAQIEERSRVALEAADQRRAQARVLEQIRIDPALAYRELQTPTSALASGLDDYQRQVAINQAATEHQQALANDRAAYTFSRTEQERRDTALAEEARKGLDDMLVKGDLAGVQQALPEVRSVLTPTDYRFYLQRIAAGGGLEDAGKSTNPDVYVNLFNRAAAGELVAADADQYTRGGQLTLADRDRIVKMSAEKRFGGAEKYLGDKLRVGEGVESMTGRTLAADAQRAMLEWRGRNPDATEEEAMDKAVELGSRYSLLNLSEQESAMATPKLAVGNRTDGFDLDATEDAITDYYVNRHGLAGQPPDAIEAALAADQEYQDELALVARWRVTQGAKLANQPVGKR